jgi:hypothetical protein
VFKIALIDNSGGRCAICSEAFEERYLQIDHRIPYEVAGDVAFDESDLASYMLLDGSCNRAKSWSCEHCPNSSGARSPEVCMGCYWASPESYTHVATQDARRLDLTWIGDETKVYDRLKSQAGSAKETMPEFVKRILRQVISRK